MAKRSATSELNHDNWNDEEETEEAGNFQQAPAEVLQTRVMRQAKRKLIGNGGENKSNAFAGFGGFGSSTPKPSTNLFSFLGKPASSPEAKKIENGQTSKATPTDENGNEAEYLANLKVLNETVTSWVAEHVKKNPCCVLTPIFQDYEKHLKDLEEKRKSKKTESVQVGKKETDKEATSTKADSSKFLFGKAISPTHKDSTDESKSEPSKVESVGKFEFGKAGSTPSLNLFGNPSTTSAAPFSFGSANKPPSLFTFGGTTSQTTATTTAPFSFGFSSMPKPAPAVEEKDKGEGDEEGGEDEDEDTPPKVEVKKVEEDDAFYSIRCKLFYKKDNAYAEKGVGNLFLKKVDDKTQLVVRAETTLGNILLNIFLNPQLTTQRVGKNNVMMVCIPNPPIDPKTPPAPTPMLFRVKTDQEADELLKTLDEAKKQ